VADVFGFMVGAETCPQQCFDGIQLTLVPDQDVDVAYRPVSRVGIKSVAVGPRILLIVVSELGDEHRVVAHFINETVFIIDAPGPVAGERVL